MNSDEFYTGLQAIAILEGDRPVIYRGIGYTAVLDSYMLAPFYWFLESPITLLKLFNAPWWGLTALVAALTSRKYLGLIGMESKLIPFIVGGIIWITPGGLLITSTRAWEAYGLLLLGIAVTQYVSLRCVECDGRTTKESFFLGAAAGFTFFLHPMTVTATLPMLIVPSFKGRSNLRTFWIPAIAGGLIANLGTFAWNIKNHWLTFVSPPPQDSYLDRLVRIFTGLLPRGFGFMNYQGTWTVPTISFVLYLIVLLLCILGITVLSKKGAFGLSLAVPALLVWPLLANLTPLWFVTDGRYAIIGIVQSVIVMTFGLHAIAQRLRKMVNGGTALRITAALPATFAVIWIIAGGIFWLRANAGPAVDDPNARMRAVTELLESENVNYAAGNYWHVQPVEYLSGGDIHVAVAGHPWGAYLDWRPELPWAVLFPARQPEVAAQPDTEVAYIFDASDEQIGTLRMAPEAYTRHQIGSSIVYIPNR